MKLDNNTLILNQLNKINYLLEISKSNNNFLMQEINSNIDSNKDFTSKILSLINQNNNFKDDLYNLKINLSSLLSNYDDSLYSSYENSLSKLQENILKLQNSLILNNVEISTSEIEQSTIADNTTSTPEQNIEDTITNVEDKKTDDNLDIVIDSIVDNISNNNDISNDINNDDNNIVEIINEENIPSTNNIIIDENTTSTPKDEINKTMQVINNTIDLFDVENCYTYIISELVNNYPYLTITKKSDLDNDSYIESNYIGNSLDLNEINSFDDILTNAEDISTFDYLQDTNTTSSNNLITENTISKIDIDDSFINEFNQIFKQIEETISAFSIEDNSNTKEDEDIELDSNISNSDQIIDNIIEKNTTNDNQIDLENLIQDSNTTAENNLNNTTPSSNEDSLFDNITTESTEIKFEKNLTEKEQLENKYESFLKNDPDFATLVISQKEGIVTLPYTKEQISLSRYKNYHISRFKETYNLVKHKEHKSFAEAFSLATELMFRSDLHPAIITACQNIDELDVYLSCLDYNTLNKFPFFEIRFEASPIVQNNLSIK